MLNRNLFLIILILTFCFANSNICCAKVRIHNTAVVQMKPLIKEIPMEWLTFQPKELPFVPFSGIDYNKMYETPVDIKLYAGYGRSYNPNYKPYVPNKRLYVTDYSYNAFRRETKNYEDINKSYSKYNDWLWNKIRSDFKRVHGMYNAKVIDDRGLEHKITWEDGGIVSIYEQVKIFYEYAKNPNDSLENQNLKFLHNFRFPYKDVRVNNPFLEFVQPKVYSNNTNQLFVRGASYDIPYKDEYQNLQPKNGVIRIEKDNNTYSGIQFIGPDGKFYVLMKYFGQIEIKPVSIPYI